MQDAAPQRRVSDGGIGQLLKAISLLLRKRGFDRKKPTPFEFLEIHGQPLVVTGTRSEEEAVHALEQVVHLVRASSEITTVRLTDCAISGQRSCISEVGRLMKQLGAGSTAHFLQEVDLSQNLLDDESARKIVESAIKERYQRGSGEVPRGPLWLDLSCNCIKHPQMLFDRLQAWASWTYREGALCLAQSPKCTKEACPRGALLHLPRFLEQGRESSRVILLERGHTRQREEAEGANEMPLHNGRNRSPVRLLPARRPVVNLVGRRSRSRSSRSLPQGSNGCAADKSRKKAEGSQEEQEEVSEGEEEEDATDDEDEEEEEEEGEETSEESEEEGDSDESEICGRDVEAAPNDVSREREAAVGRRAASSEERVPLTKDKIEEKLDRLLSILAPPPTPAQPTAPERPQETAA